MLTLIPRKMLLVMALAALGCGVVATVAVAKMRSERVDRHLCKTTGGGRFVDIPSFPGEKIDRRLLRDIRWMQRKFKIFITDGYSTDPVHSANGEHPIGLALDIVPDRSEGGRWRDIGRLARWAEPTQNQPRAPFRWVGYNGDAHHGRGHHLHLSYAHSKARFGKPTRTAYSVRCPKRPDREPKPEPESPPQPPQSGGTDDGAGGDRSSGGLQPTGTGGFGPHMTSRKAKRVKRKIKRQARRSASRESGGVGVR